MHEKNYRPHGENELEYVQPVGAHSRALLAASKETGPQACNCKQLNLASSRAKELGS